GTPGRPDEDDQSRDVRLRVEERPQLGDVVQCPHRGRRRPCRPVACAAAGRERRGREEEQSSSHRRLQRQAPAASAAPATPAAAPTIVELCPSAALCTCAENRVTSPTAGSSASVTLSPKRNRAQ